MESKDSGTRRASPFARAGARPQAEAPANASPTPERASAFTPRATPAALDTSGSPPPAPVAPPAAPTTGRASPFAGRPAAA